MRLNNLEALENWITNHPSKKVVRLLKQDLWELCEGLPARLFSSFHGFAVLTYRGVAFFAIDPTDYEDLSDG